MGEGSSGADHAPAHAWLVLRQEPAGECFLVHLPPRESVQSDGRVHGAPAGSVRIAARIKNVPLGLAVDGSDVYLLFDAPRGAASREVWSLAARPAGLGDLWRYEPDTRLTPRPSLPLEILPRAFFGAAGYIFVLGAAPGADPVLHVLAGDRWAPVTAPDDLAAATRLPGRHALAYQTGPGFVIAIGEGDATLAWEATVRSGLGGLPAIDWTLLPPGSARVSEAAGQVQCGDTPIHWEQQASVIRCEVEVGGSFQPLAVIDGASENVSVMAAGRSRLIVAWSEPVPPDPDTRGSKLRYKLNLTEISADTGQVLYAGPPKGTSPISEGQFRYLALGLVALTGAVLIFILRSSGRDEQVNLDPLMSLAEPGRRALAFLIDLAAAGIVASRVLNLEVSELWAPSALLNSTGPWVLVTLALGLAVSVVFEWTFGRTPGKFLTGCEVVALLKTPGAGPSTARPALWQIVARNLIKWGLPPVSGIALIDPTLRHQGERLTRTAVILREEPDESGEV